jgi:hypothetical protein
MFSAIAEALKAILGLSGLAYLAGFIVVNAMFLSWGVSEADLVSARYVAAGALFLFLGVPVTVFPYLQGLEALNVRYKKATDEFLSNDLHSFYDANRGLITSMVGRFFVVAAGLIFCLLLEGAWRSGALADVTPLLSIFVVWYVASYLLARLATIFFNLGFYWRAHMLSAEGPFWRSFRESFVRSFRVSFRRSFHLSAGRDPTTQEIDQALSKYALGLGPRGFLASALYKGIALFIVNAVTFGWFVYPLLPAAIGGGKTQTVVLSLPAEKGAAVLGLGVPGETVATGEADSRSKGERFVTRPLALLAKTSDAYFVLTESTAGTTVVRIPTGSVEAASYRALR